MMYFVGEESCAIISVSGTRLLCPLGLSDPPFTNDKDDDSFHNFFPGKVSSMMMTMMMKMLTLKLCVSRGDKKIIHNADSACLSFLVSSALLTFLSEKTSLQGGKYQKYHMLKFSSDQNCRSLSLSFKREILMYVLHLVSNNNQKIEKTKRQKYKLTK